MLQIIENILISPLSFLFYLLHNFILSVIIRDNFDIECEIYIISSCFYFLISFVIHRYISKNIEQYIEKNDNQLHISLTLIKNEYLNPLFLFCLSNLLIILTLFTKEYVDIIMYMNIISLLTFSNMFILIFIIALLIDMSGIIEDYKRRILTEKIDSEWDMIDYYGDDKDDCGISLEPIEDYFCLCTNPKKKHTFSYTSIKEWIKHKGDIICPIDQTYEIELIKYKSV